MPESSVVVRPKPMDSGSYTAGSRLQAAGLQRAIKLFEQAAEAVPLPRLPQPVVIADYGASTGHNSLLPICAAIAVLRKRTRPEHSIMVVHTDVPENDFTMLFQTLATDPDTYLRKDEASFASAIGRSFYSQILPSNSVNLGWTSWAILWLRRVPAPIHDHVHVAYSSDEAVRAAYAKQAAHDWHDYGGVEASARSAHGCPALSRVCGGVDRGGHRVSAEANCLLFATMHRAKGLEFQNVIVTPRSRPWCKRRSCTATHLRGLDPGKAESGTAGRDISVRTATWRPFSAILKNNASCEIAAMADNLRWLFVAGGLALVM